MAMPMNWKKGRGKLGILTPLLGTWHAHADAPDGRPGRVQCTRHFVKDLHDTYVVLTAIWDLGDKTYEERCFFGCDAAKNLRFWSFTSDGKQSNGELTEATDIHPQAIAFIAQMPAGIARLSYWPDEASGFHFAVESKSQKGWNRFVHHHYLAVAEIQTAISTTQTAQ